MIGIKFKKKPQEQKQIYHGKHFLLEEIFFLESSVSKWTAYNDRKDKQKSEKKKGKFFPFLVKISTFKAVFKYIFEETR